MSFCYSFSVHLGFACPRPPKVLVSQFWSKILFFIPQFFKQIESVLAELRQAQSRHETELVQSADKTRQQTELMESLQKELDSIRTEKGILEDQYKARLDTR